MKTILKIIIIAALVILFGALPLKIFGVIFEWIAGALKTLADWLDFFGWGGIL